MTKEELLEKTKNDANQADINAALTGRQLVKSMKFCQKLMADIRNAKKGIKAMSRENIPTGTLTAVVKDLNEKLVQRRNIVSVVKNRYYDACDYRNFCVALVEELERT
jgi:hypothetical protein